MTTLPEPVGDVWSRAELVQSRVDAAKCRFPHERALQVLIRWTGTDWLGSFASRAWETVLDASGLSMEAIPMIAARSVATTFALAFLI